jgi:M6 family metalloprotease-like protein
MKRSFLITSQPMWLTIMWLLIPVNHALCATTLEDFGFRHRQTRAQWPTLVILGRFGYGSFNNYDTQFWQDRVFNINPPNHGVSYNGFFHQASSGRFQLTNAAVLKVELNSSMTVTNLQSKYPKKDGWEIDMIHNSNIISQAMSQFDFKSHDDNGDGQVTRDELLILLILNEEGGAVRDAGHVPAHGVSSIAWEGYAAMQMDTAGLETGCHELSHLLGAVDLYGLWGGGEQRMNQQLSVMSSGLCLHDSWHRMQFGWLQPMLEVLSDGGRFRLYGTQLEQPMSSVLLYDPGRGSKEFFLLEYRTRTSSGGGQYEVGLPEDGLVIWHVYQDANQEPVQYPDIAYPNSQTDWHICTNCMTLVHKTKESAPCAGGGHHALFPNESRLVVTQPNVPISGQPNWFMCSNCGQLVGAFAGASDSCPANSGHHAIGGGANYSLFVNSPSLVGFHHWARCTNCRALYYTPRQSDSHCASTSGGTHSPGPDTYTLLARWSQITVMSQGAPDLLLGGNSMWTSNTVTPFLTWYDGTPTPVKLHVEPFDTGEDSIMIEVLSERETWLDFGFVGVEQGTFDHPFRTLEKALNATAYAGTLKIKAGITTEAASVSKPMNIESYGGDVILGQH